MLALLHYHGDVTDHLRRNGAHVQVPMVGACGSSLEAEVRARRWGCGRGGGGAGAALTATPGGAPVFILYTLDHPRRSPDLYTLYFVL